MNPVKKIKCKGKEEMRKNTSGCGVDQSMKISQ
jgi:hypothetical protein